MYILYSVKNMYSKFVFDKSEENLRFSSLFEVLRVMNVGKNVVYDKK